MYKIKLTKQQINKILDTTDKDSTQKTLMSILSYLIKYTDATTNTLSKSLSKLYKMYIRYHGKITRSYFYTLVGKLKDNNLLSFALKDDNFEDNFEDKINQPYNVESTYIDSDFEKHNNKYINNTYTYTLNTTEVVKSEIEKVNALDLVDDVFRTFEVKSKEIKSMVIAKLQNVVLDAAGAINYIVKVLTEKTEQYNNMRVKYAQQVVKTKYSKSNNTYSAPVTRTFNNFEHSSFYDDIEYMKSLENTLLGWNE